VGDGRLLVSKKDAWLSTEKQSFGAGDDLDLGFLYFKWDNPDIWSQLMV